MGLERRGEAECLRQLGGARIREDAAVGEEHCRLGGMCLLLEPVGNPEPGDRRAQRVGAGRAGLRDDCGAGRPLPAQPRRLLEQLGDRPVEDLVRNGRRAQHVEVDPAARHALEDELGERSIQPAEPRDQEPAPRRRMEAANAREQLGAALARREHDRDDLARRPRLLEDRDQLVVRAAADRVVAAVAPSELVGDAAALRRVVVGDHEQRFAGGWAHGCSTDHPTTLCASAPCGHRPEEPCPGSKPGDVSRVRFPCTLTISCPKRTRPGFDPGRVPRGRVFRTSSR